MFASKRKAAEAHAAAAAQARRDEVAARAAHLADFEARSRAARVATQAAFDVDGLPRTARRAQRPVVLADALSAGHRLTDRTAS